MPDEGQEPSAVLTRDAYERLRGELDRLTSEGRRVVAERLKQAREHGDIRENAEFDAAKDEQGLMEGRIRELERLLKHPQIVEQPATTEEVGPGTIVTVKPVEEGEDEETYLLAFSKEERLPGVRTVTTSSPLGQALLGKRIGDRVSYEAPGGEFTYEVTGLKPQIG
jgi:transcription elongation factor GreA